MERLRSERYKRAAKRPDYPAASDDEQASAHSYISWLTPAWHTRKLLPPMLIGVRPLWNAPTRPTVLGSGSSAMKEPLVAKIVPEPYT